ncbi:DinB family protein [bacterium]|nr:DinB family protein [bacterium]
MKYDINESIAILERTPAVLHSLLSGLPGCWTQATEGGESWSAYDILGHLIHGERTDWIERTQRILEHGESKPFEPFDRFAQFADSQDKSLDQLLEEFAALRAANIARLREMAISEEQLPLKGSHPALGTVTLSQLLATWTVHDLGHIYQIVRTMAAQYKAEVGPWVEYLRVLQESGIGGQA